jgi:MFS family permease
VRALAVDISPLRESVGFRALWGGQVISMIGTHMRVVAVAFQVFALTRSAAAVGLIGLAELGPLILFSIVGGPLIDALDRRRILYVCQVLLLLNSATLAALTLTGEPALGAIYVLVGLDGAVTAIERPTRTAMIPSLVRREHLSAALALRQVVFQLTHIVGPAIGGLLIALLGGVGWLYVLDATTFLVALVVLRWVPSTRATFLEDGGDEPRVTLSAIREGFAYAFRTPLILSILLIDLVAMIFGMPRAVFPALADGVFSVGASGLGLLYAAPATGALLGALTMGWVGRVRRQGTAVVLAASVWGAAVALAGLSLFSFPLTLWWLAVAGAADVVSAVFRSTLLLDTTPEELRGRIYGLNFMVVSGGPRLGDFEAGVAAEFLGPGPSIVLGGVACVAGTWGAAALFPSLRRYRATASSEATSSP